MARGRKARTPEQIMEANQKKFRQYGSFHTSRIGSVIIPVEDVMFFLKAKSGDLISYHIDEDRLSLVLYKVTPQVPLVPSYLSEKHMEYLQSGDDVPRYGTINVTKGGSVNLSTLLIKSLLGVETSDTVLYHAGIKMPDSLVIKKLSLTKSLFPQQGKDALSKEQQETLETITCFSEEEWDKYVSSLK